MKVAIGWKVHCYFYLEVTQEWIMGIMKLRCSIIRCLQVLGHTSGTHMICSITYGVSLCSIAAIDPHVCIYRLMPVSVSSRYSLICTCALKNSPITFSHYKIADLYILNAVSSSISQDYMYMHVYMPLVSVPIVMDVATGD